MDNESTKFFLGITDFFGGLLPGILLTSILVDLTHSYFITRFPELQEEAVGWVAFLVASYLLGQFVYLMGTALDPIYDKTYRIKTSQGKIVQDLRGRVADVLPEVVPAYNKNDSVFGWAIVVVNLRSPSASLELKRLAATSKFFRSLVWVLTFASLVFLIRGEIILGFVALGALVLSFWRFMEQRLKRTRYTYEYLLALNAMPYGEV